MTTTSEFVRRTGCPAHSGMCRERRARCFFYPILVFLVLLSARVIAQDCAIATNPADLAQQAFSGDHSLWLPNEPWHWQAYSLDGGLPFFVDCSAVPCSALLPASTNLNGVDIFSIDLAKNVLTGEILFQSSWSTDVIARVEAPSGYQPGTASEDRGVWWEWQQYTNCLACWTDPGAPILPPIVTLTVLVADLQNKPVWDAAVAAQAAAAEAEAAAAAEALSTPSLAMDSEMTLLPMDNSDPCSITNDADPFSMMSLSPDGGGAMVASWASCPDHVYIVQAESSLTPTSSWADVAWMWGSNLTTTWSDSNAVGQTQGFYRVVRGNPNTLNNGIPYGWAVTYGLDPLDPNLALGDPAGDGFSNLEKYLLGYTPNQYLVGPPGGSVTTLRYYYDQDGRLVDAFYTTAGAETFALTPGHNLQQDNALSH